MRIAGGIAGILLAFFLANAAHAHATLVSTDPGDNAVLTQAPKMVQLRFNEAVAPAAVRLIDAEGKTREVVARAVDQSLLIALPDDLPQGTQLISYRVVSQDGHPVGGTIMFSVGAPTRAAAARTQDGSLAILIWLARMGVYLGLFAGVGGVFFAAWIGKSQAGASAILGALYGGVVCRASISLACRSGAWSRPRHGGLRSIRASGHRCCLRSRPCWWRGWHGGARRSRLPGRSVRCRWQAQDRRSPRAGTLQQPRRNG